MPDATILHSQVLDFTSTFTNASGVAQPLVWEVVLTVGASAPPATLQDSADHQSTTLVPSDNIATPVSVSVRAKAPAPSQVATPYKTVLINPDPNTITALSIAVGTPRPKTP